MKHLVFCLLILFPLAAFCQGQYVDISSPSVRFDSAANYIMSKILNDYPDDTSEGGQVNAFRRWVDFSGNRIALDVPADSSMFKPAGIGLLNYLQNKNTYCINDTTLFVGNWKCMGPYIDYYGPSKKEYQGRIDAIWVNPNNPDTILAGANAGGLWKSIDGGENWFNITDPSPTNGSLIPGTMGANKLAVNPLDYNNIYIAANIEATSKKSTGYAMGLFYTEDGGASWNYDTDFLATNQQTIIDYNTKWVKKIAFMPNTEHLFAISNNKILLKEDPSANWIEITPQGLAASNIFTDFEFTKLSSSKVVFSTDAYNDTSHLWILDISSSPVTWTDLAVTLPTPYLQDNGDKIVDITITAEDTVYFIIEHRTTSGGGVIRSAYSTPLSTVSLTLLRYSTGAIDFIEVSPSNPDIVYSGVATGINSFFRSTNRLKISGDIGQYTHADARCLLIYTTDSTGAGDIVYGGSDGGIVVKRSSNNDMESITGKGLAITQFYGLSNTEADENIMVGGSQDNSSFSFVKERQEQWRKEPNAYGDNFLTKFANNGITEAIIEFQPPSDLKKISSLAKITFLDTITDVDTIKGTYDYISTCQHCEPNNLQRPILYDPDTNIFIGFQFIWTKSFSDTNWQLFNSIQPLSGFMVCDFVFSEQNQDTAYIAYRNPNWGNPIIQQEDHKLFRSDQANSSSPSWVAISPGNVVYNRINDIEVVPNNLSRIWIALGDFNIGTVNLPPDEMTGRIAYSDDYGTTWDDSTYSRGLPPVPVNKILYQKGTNDRLFAGTDVGVFVWNLDSMKWTCFSNGMPPCMVTDMEFNYCSSKLRVATFGRGIWETPLYPDDRITPNSVVTINTNSTWNAAKYLEGSVTIKSGSTLTISGSTTTIYMPKNAVILIEPNAKLVVDSATITNACEECLWGGIRVSGNFSQVQSATNQGTVELYDATIEHASVAIGNYDENKSQASTGGIILANNTRFLNNERAVDLQQYHKNASTILKFYKAQFNRCVFEIDDDYKFDNGAGYLGNNPHRFFSHVALYDLNGPTFTGCSFYNNNTGQYKAWGEGIISTNAGLFVKGYCANLMNVPCNPADLTRSKFSGFKHGIWIESDNMHNNYASKIDQSFFDSCSIGVRVIGRNKVHFVRDSFSIGNGAEVDIDGFDCHKNIGIFATTTPFVVTEDNYFQGITHAGQHQDHENIGSVVQNSGADDKEVYHNYFDDLEKACLAIGNNDDPNIFYPTLNSTGLQYLCNSYDGNTYDIYVSTTANPFGQKVYGIANHQGNKDTAAGNSFSGASSDQIVNIGAAFTYYYSSTIPAINANSGWVVPLQASLANSCPSRYNPTTGSGWNAPLTSGPLSSAKANYYTYNALKEGAQQQLDDYIDLGNTTDLLTFINNCTITDTAILRDTLTTISPYVSKEALKASADLNVLDKSVFQVILESNPETLKDDEFLYYLGNSIPMPFNPTEIEGLQNTAAITTTSRTVDESKIVANTLLRNRYANIVLGHYLMDTVDTDQDSIPVWYDNMNTLEAEYAKAEFYTGIGDYGSASTIIDNIPTKFTLTQEQSDDHDVYADLWDLIASVLDDDRNLYSLTETEQGDLEDILAATRTIGGSVDNSLLVISDVTVGPIARLACATAIGIGSPKPGRSSFANDKKPTPQMIKVYPNPADQFVIFEYNVPSNVESLQIEVSNTSGQVVYNTLLSGNAGKQKWNTTAMASGVYHYRILNKGQTIQTGKVVLAK